MIETCPGCQANLVSNTTTFRTTTRTIGVEISSISGAMFWQCPDCGHQWHRWPPGDSRRLAAEPYVRAIAPVPKRWVCTRGGLTACSPDAAHGKCGWQARVA